MTGNYFNKKRVLVTGASSGIGAALARHLDRQGARLILTGRDRSRLAKVVDPLTPTVETIVGDLRQPEVIRQLSDFVSHDGLDLAILNAGTSHYNSGDGFDVAAYHRLMADNLTTMVDCIGAVLPALIRSRGHLALTSSLAGYAGLPQAAAYCASKAAIRATAQSLDLDLRPKGVAVSCICPGFVQTPLTDKNTFQMPFLIDSDRAAGEILKGLSKQSHEIHFPKRLSLLMKFLTSLPAALQYRIFRLSANQLG